jgi:hypothetical protein
MGCEGSKPIRLPRQGDKFSFEVTPAPGGGATTEDFVIYDATNESPYVSSKWFMMTVTGSSQPEGSKVARLRGPCELSVDEQQTPIVLAIGEAKYKELPEDRPADVSAAEEASAWESWPKEKPYKQTRWQISRSVVGTNQRGRAEMKAHVTFTGCTRASEDSDNPDVLRISKCLSVSYAVTVGGKPQKVEGGRSAVVDSSVPHYEGTWDLGSLSVRCFFHNSYSTAESMQLLLHKRERYTAVEVTESCPPLGGLCLGVAMQRWLHPLTAEELADVQAWSSSPPDAANLKDAEKDVSFRSLMEDDKVCGA